MSSTCRPGRIAEGPEVDVFAADNKRWNSSGQPLTAHSPRFIPKLVPDGETAGTATLVVGHCKSSKGDVKPAALEFSFEGLSDEAQRRGFSVEPAKGTVEPGATKAVTVSFAPSADAVKGSELGVAQWAEAELKCVLKGGNPPPEQPETRIAIQGYIAAEGVAGS